ncbi:MAG: hypothetical protein U9N73_13645 [Candidatus Auribacterota bacterium]|nr:hypothetical protein [Candidatus Auribacterota bacterium]
MMYSLKIITAGCFILPAFIIFPGPAKAKMGDVVNWFYTAEPHTRDYYGGITWKDGYLYENNATTYKIYKRSSTSGEVLGTIPISNRAKDFGISWDPDHNCWWVAEPWVTGLGKLPADGGYLEFTWRHDSILNICGVTYDPIDKVLLVCRNGKYCPAIEQLDVSKYPPRLVSEIQVGYSMRGVARAGNRYWVSQKSNGSPFYVNELTLEGNHTGRWFTLPEGREAWELAFDGRYLWVRSNNSGGTIKIFQVDIEYSSNTPTPPPPPGEGSNILDYNGDGISDIGIFRPASGLWAIRNITRTYFGSEGDLIAPGDYNGDGKTEPGIFRPESGAWASTSGMRCYFGGSNDRQVPGDYNGDGYDDIAIFRESTGMWAIRAITRRYFGTTGDIPINHDFNGDGTTDLGIFRPDNGLWAISGITRAYFGREGDYLVPGDYTGSGESQIAIFRPENGLWAIKGYTRIYYGDGGYLPQPADWNNDGKTDITAFFRNNNAWWWASSPLGTIPYGRDGDQPIVARIFKSGVEKRLIFDNRIGSFPVNK